MARRMIYLPDDLDEALRHQDVNISRVCRDALMRLSKICPTCGRPYEQEKEEPSRRRVTRTPRSPGEVVVEKRKAQAASRRTDKRLDDVMKTVGARRASDM